MTKPPLSPGKEDAAGVFSWSHVGDMHKTVRGEQNRLDLQAVVKVINTSFAGTISFVYLPGDALPLSGSFVLRVEAEDVRGRIARDEIHAPAPGAGRAEPDRRARDQDNGLPAWPEHGLLGTQPGPNKYGRKW